MVGRPAATTNRDRGARGGRPGAPGLTFHGLGPEPGKGHAVPAPGMASAGVAGSAHGRRGLGHPPSRRWPGSKRRVAAGPRPRGRLRVLRDRSGDPPGAPARKLSRPRVSNFPGAAPRESLGGRHPVRLQAFRRGCGEGIFPHSPPERFGFAWAADALPAPRFRIGEVPTTGPDQPGSRSACWARGAAGCSTEVLGPRPPLGRARPRKSRMIAARTMATKQFSGRRGLPAARPSSGRDRRYHRSRGAGL